MRVLCYNIENGGEERREALVAAINRLDADVALLCELNGWNSGSHVNGLNGYLSVNEESVTGYRTGILTRQKPWRIRCFNDGMHHGALIVTVDGLTIIAAHLHPFEEKVRMKEAELLVTICSGIGGPLIVGGDLNSLPTGHERSGAPTLLRRGGLFDPLSDNPEAYTIHTGRSPKDPNWRFDYILSRGIVWHSMEVLHGAAYANLSDHWPIFGISKTGMR